MYKVDVDKGRARERWLDVCPTESIPMVDGHAFIDLDECIECGSCAAECSEEAIIEVD